MFELLESARAYGTGYIRCAKVVTLHDFRVEKCTGMYGNKYIIFQIRQIRVIYFNLRYLVYKCWFSRVRYGTVHGIYMFEYGTVR